MNNIYIGLVHYPVYNKNQKVVCTSVTNLDIHDIARTSKTYNIKKYFIINPQASQRKIFMRLQDFWKSDVAKNYNVSRFNAFEIIEFVSSISETKQKIKDEISSSPTTFTTSAKNSYQSINYSRATDLIVDSKSSLILFGTAHGLAHETIAQNDYNISPITGAGDYNHLSVRSAVAITLDRIIGDYK